MDILEVKVILLVLVGQAVFVDYGFATGSESFKVGRSNLRYLLESEKGKSLHYKDGIEFLGMVPLDGGRADYGDMASSTGDSAENDEVNRFKRVASFNEFPRRPNFSYRVSDGEDNVHYRSEQRDPNGNVRGTYGYTNNRGLYREVQYVADENGFRATIKTNEPGTDDKKSPANVQIVAEEPPPGIYEQGIPFGRPTPRPPAGQPSDTTYPPVTTSKPGAGGFSGGSPGGGAAGQSYGGGYGDGFYGGISFRVKPEPLYRGNSIRRPGKK